METFLILLKQAIKKQALVEWVPLIDEILKQYAPAEEADAQVSK